jgi:hypothetical protein
MAEEVKSKVKVEITTQTAPIRTGQRVPRLEEGVFYEALTSNIGEINTNQVRLFVEELEKLGIEKLFRSTSLSLRVRNPKDPDDPLGMTILNFSTDGKIGRGGGLNKRIERWGLPTTPAEEFVSNLNKINKGFHTDKTERGEYGWPTVKLDQVITGLPEIKNAVQKFLEQLHIEEEKEE